MSPELEETRQSRAKHFPSEYVYSAAVETRSRNRPPVRQI
jgi:hypothetical protein